MEAEKNEQKGHSVMGVSHKIRKVVPRKVKPQKGDVLLDIELVIRDKDGKEVSRYQEYGDSFVANFIKILYCCAMAHASPDSLTLKDTGGIIRDASGYEGNSIFNKTESIQCFDCNATSTDTTHGIIVGTGTTPTDINDYALDTKVEEGTGAGQMEHGNHSIVNSTHDGSNYSYAGITRTIANNSGGAIDVAEVGLVCRMRWESSLENFLLLREVLGTPKTVPNTQTLTATIRIKCYC